MKLAELQSFRRVAQRESRNMQVGGPFTSCNKKRSVLSSATPPLVMCAERSRSVLSLESSGTGVDACRMEPHPAPTAYCRVGLETQLPGLQYSGMKVRYLPAL